MEHKKNLEKEFKKLTKNKFLKPENCTQLQQTRECLFELHEIIKHFEAKFSYIPSSAQLLFNAYNTKQEKMLFEEYRQKYMDE